MRIKSFLHSLLFVKHKSPANPTPVSTRTKQELQAALVKCTVLSTAEVEAYIAYEFEGIVYEDVPFDYQPEHLGEEISCLYADGILQAKVLRRHTNQIAPEILAKVQQILPEILCPPTLGVVGTEHLLHVNVSTASQEATKIPVK